MKKRFLTFISLILAFSVGGCGLVPSVELTESEQDVITEYAAGLLLKHDKNYTGVISKTEEEQDDLAIVSEVNSEEEQFNDNIDDGENNYTDPEFSEDITASPQDYSDDAEYSDISIAEAVGLEGFDVIYKDYLCSNLYPPEESSDMVFSLESAPGMELLVLSFGITNNTPDRKTCDVLNSNAVFRLLINGSERVQAQKTMLLHDFSTCEDDIEGYGVAEAVLVFEIAEGTSATINSIDLVVKNSNENTTHKLR